MFNLTTGTDFCQLDDFVKDFFLILRAVCFHSTALTLVLACGVFFSGVYLGNNRKGTVGPVRMD
jgi:hypothetical protein